MAEEKPCSPPPEAPRCPVCGETFSRSSLVLCRDCASPHHRKCWTFNKGCATYGCQSRSFVLPPVAAGDDLEFSTRGDFGLGTHLLLLGAFTAPLLVLAGLALAFPAALLEKLLFGVFLTWICTVWFVPLLPLFTEKRYEISCDDQAVHRVLSLGSFRFLSERPWRTFSDVEGLEVRHSKSFGQHQEQKRLEVWLRDRRGEKHCIDHSILEDRDETLAKVEAAAELLDTTVSLPRSVTTVRELPAGLARAITSLPRRGPDDEIPALEGGSPEAGGPPPEDGDATPG